MLPAEPEESDVRAAVERALEALFEQDAHLLCTDASERSLTHRLAVHVHAQSPNFDVDCEYNRDGFDVKKLMLSSREVKDDELDAVTVFPDVIVHKRGQQDQNLLVLEMKKDFSSLDQNYDIQKLKAFKEQLSYRFAAHAVIGFREDSKLTNELKWQ